MASKESSSRCGQLLVVSLPSGPDYRPYYERSLAAANANLTDIVNFFLHFSQAVSSTEDDLLVLYPNGTDLIRQSQFPAGTYFLPLARDTQLDLWMRDFTTVGTRQMLKFRYAPKYLSSSEAKFTEDQFLRFMNWLGHPFEAKELKEMLALDGGNVVDCEDKAIISRRIEKENKKLTAQKIHAEVVSRVGMQVCMIPDPGDSTGHADGIVSFIDAHNLIVGDYSLGKADAHHRDTMNSIKHVWPEMNVTELTCRDPGSVAGFSSAVGCYVNSLVTDCAVYMPAFGDAEEDARASRVVGDLAKAVGKQFRTVDTGKLSHMGGSVRCMTWQMYRDNHIAQELLSKAQKNS